MSITASNNPFSCTPVLVGNNNAILELGTITRVSNTFTFSIGFKWRINALTYQNASAIDLTIIPATTGFKRIDVAVLNTSNTIELLSGVESETIALQPTIPVNALVLTTWNINGVTIEDEATPLIGEDYVKKSFALAYVYPDITGADASIPIPANGASQIVMSNASLTSITCLDLSAITGNPSAEVPYPNKVLEITNLTGNDIELKHATGSGIQFFTKDELSIIIPNKETLYVKYNTDGAIEFDRSWSDIIIPEDDIYKYFKGDCISHQATGATVTSIGGALLTLVGSGSNGTSNFAGDYVTNPYLTWNHRRQATAASAGLSAEAYRSESRISSVGLGFYKSAKVATITSTNSRSFFGLNDSLSAMGNVNPSTLFNLLGFGRDTGDSNLQIIHNDGSGTATKIDLGSNFSIETINAYVYEIWNFLGSSTCYFRIKNLKSNITSPVMEVSTDLPNVNTGLTTHDWLNNGTDTSTVALYFSNITVLRQS